MTQLGQQLGVVRVVRPDEDDPGRELQPPPPDDETASLGRPPQDEEPLVTGTSPPSGRWTPAHVDTSGRLAPHAT
jgi:hypothetical protein